MKVDTLSFPAERAHRYLVRLTKGLLCAFYPEYDYSEDVFELRFVEPTRDNFDLVRDLITHLRYEERGDGVFRVWYGISSDSGKSGAWVYTFCDGACFLVIQHHKELPLRQRTIAADQE